MTYAEKASLALMLLGCAGSLTIIYLVIGEPLGALSSATYSIASVAMGASFVVAFNHLKKS